MTRTRTQTLLRALSIRPTTRTAFVFVLTIVLTSMLPGAADATERVTLKVDGRKRNCWVHVPPKLDRDRPAPLVLLFHGAGGNGKWQLRYSGMDEKADQEGFIVACPDGTGRLRRWMLTWNAGDCCGYASSKKVDDLAYIDRLLTELARRYKVDPSRIYAAGLSNGGMMCYRIADVMADRIAAIAVISGTHLGDRPDPARPVPVIHFHGTKDLLVPFEGGSSKEWSPQFGFRGARDCAALWARTNRCHPEPETTRLEDQHEEDGTSIAIERFVPGTDGAEVVLYVIEGGGHTWPGRSFFSRLEAPRFVRRISPLGRSTEEISANDLLWDFFVRHPLPPATTAEAAAGTPTPTPTPAEKPVPANGKSDGV